MAADPDLAERVRKAWDEFRYTPAGRTSFEVCADIAQAEADRAWNEALRGAQHAIDTTCSTRPLIRAALVALQRPQQPDQPAQMNNPHSPRPDPLPDGSLSDAEILERAAQISRRERILCEIDNELFEENAARLRAQAQAAPEVDVFASFVAEVRSGSEGRTLPWSAMESLARDTFGPAIKALEEMPCSCSRQHLLMTASQHTSRCPVGVLTALHERARRVGR